MRTVILFSKENCPPCKMAKSILQDLIDKKLVIVLDGFSEEAGAFAVKHKIQIQGVPNFCFLEDGKMVEQLVGNRYVGEVINFLTNNQ